MTAPDSGRVGNEEYDSATTDRTRAANRRSALRESDIADDIDDVSFVRGRNTDQTSDMMREMTRRGIASAEEVIDQLQAKASELTANLIDKVKVDDLAEKLEQQVRDHPARTLLFAVGAGLLIGRAARK
jgi:ElaB/YqjD/DUF883 family membrane-anchored ribosome-binding protein